MPLDDHQLQAAETCEDCTGWVQHCGAECCRVFTFYVTPRSDIGYVGDSVRIHVPPMDDDTRRYYELHGARVEEGEFVVVPRDACVTSPSLLEVKMRCSALDDRMLCELHGERQPACCREFTAETASSSDWILPPRCLFNYKAKARPEDRTA